MIAQCSTKKAQKHAGKSVPTSLVGEGCQHLGYAPILSLCLLRLPSLFLLQPMAGFRRELRVGQQCCREYDIVSENNVIYCM